MPDSRLSTVVAPQCRAPRPPRRFTRRVKLCPASRPGGWAGTIPGDWALAVAARKGHPLPTLDRQREEIMSPPHFWTKNYPRFVPESGAIILCGQEAVIRPAPWPLVRNSRYYRTFASSRATEPSRRLDTRGPRPGPAEAWCQRSRHDPVVLAGPPGGGSSSAKLAVAADPTSAGSILVKKESLRRFGCPQLIKGTIWTPRWPGCCSGQCPRAGSGAHGARDWLGIRPELLRLLRGRSRLGETPILGGTGPGFLRTRTTLGRPGCGPGARFAGASGRERCSPGGALDARHPPCNRG